MINIMSMMNCCIYCFSSVSPLPNYWVAHRKLKDRQAFIGDFFKSLEKLSDLEKVAYATIYSSFTRINQINFLKIIDVDDTSKFIGRNVKLKGQKAYNCGHMDMMVDIYRCTFMNQTFYIF